MARVSVPSSLWLDRILSFGKASFDLSTHRLIDSWVVSPVCGHRFSVVFSVYQGVEMLGHMMALTCDVARGCQMALQGSHTIVWSHSGVPGCRFLSTLAGLVSLILAILVSVKRWTIVASICISLICSPGVFLN